MEAAIAADLSVEPLSQTTISPFIFALVNVNWIF
jgi:hypothetical protein